VTGSFEFVAPTRVLFGSGQSGQLPTVLAGHTWGLLSTARLLTLPYVGRALKACKNAGIEIKLLGEVSPNPRVAEVLRAATSAEKIRPEGILAVGGGSVMDAAKVVAVMYRFGATLESIRADIASATAQQVRECPLVVVPTTAGTGAEVSRGAILTDLEAKQKFAVRGPQLLPSVAIIDPALSVSLSPRRTAETGFDIVTHAVETYLSKAANPLTDLLALAALDAVPAALVQTVEDGTNIDTRSVLSFHSWMMGYNLAHASTCLPHRMQYAVGSLTDTGHQAGLAALYPAWIHELENRQIPRLRNVVNRLVSSLSHCGHVLEDVTPTGVFIWLLERLDLRLSLEDLGVRRTDISFLTNAVEGRIDLDPLQPSRRDIETIFTNSLSHS